MNKTVEQWIAYGKQKRRYFFFYEERFIMFHPGGKQAIANYKNKDITEILFRVFPHHPQQTKKVLGKYQIGTIPPKSNVKVDTVVEPAAIQTPPKRVRFRKKFILDDQNDDHSNQSSQRGIEKKPSLKKPSRFNIHDQSSKKKQKKSKSKSRGSTHFPSKLSKNKSFKEDENLQFSKASQRKLRQPESISVYQQQMDQKKPILTIPILSIRHMNQL